MSQPRSSGSLAALVVLAVAACTPSSKDAPRQQDARLVVTTSTNVVPPSEGQVPVLDLTTLTADRVENYYRLTTPAGEALRFELVAWSAAGAGTSMITVQHVRDGATEIHDDPVSLARAGLMPTAPNLINDGRRVQATGDGMVRVVVQGRITQDQVLVVQSDTSGAVVVEIAIGAASEINRDPGTEPDVPGVIARDVVYSSDSWAFGIPTVATSGDRTSIVCYEGDRLNPVGLGRYELRLQHTAATGTVTGGGTANSASDQGVWRDHEIVALHNVLGVVRSEASGVRVRLSFDRGASFGQDVQVLEGFSQSRLVQAAMAADYSLAIGVWRAAANGAGLEFVLVEGRAVAFDGSGSPTWFQFTPAEVLHTMPTDASPLTTGIAWSDGGDLVVGYAASWFSPAVTGPGWLSTTEFRCATRRYGQSFVDVEVDRLELFGMDPTVAVLGEGSSLRIFYAYEMRDGIRLAVSDDAGLSFAAPVTFGKQGDHLPSVFARLVGGATRVDVLYLASRELGTELHRSRWMNWPAGPREDHALTRAALDTVPATSPWANVPPLFPWTLRSTQMGPLGYDAVLDGDHIVAVYDEVTYDGYAMCLSMAMMPNASTTMGGGMMPPTFSSAPPPPLAPGMTAPIAAPNPAHSHQLTVLRVD